MLLAGEHTKEGLLPLLLDLLMLLAPGLESTVVEVAPPPPRGLPDDDGSFSLTPPPLLAPHLEPGLDCCSEEHNILELSFNLTPFVGFSHFDVPLLPFMKI